MLKKIAHSSTLSSTLGNKDLKSLQDLITAEKAVVSLLQRLSVEISKSSEALKTWGVGEGEDLSDVLTRSAHILSHVSNAFNVFASHEQTLREHMKAIRSREEKLDESRTRRKSLGNKADAAEKKLTKMGSENKNMPSQTELLNRLREEIRNLDSDIMSDEAQIGDFKRQTTKTFMSLKLGGLLEFAEKATIVGELGKLIIEEIPMDTTIPGHNRSIYRGYEKTEKLEQEVDRCVGEVVFSATGLSHSTSAANYSADMSADMSSNSVKPPRDSEELPYTLPPVGLQGEPTSAGFVGGFASPTMPTPQRHNPPNAHNYAPPAEYDGTAGGPGTSHTLYQDDERENVNFSGYPDSGGFHDQDGHDGARQSEYDPYAGIADIPNEDHRIPPQEEAAAWAGAHPPRDSDSGEVHETASDTKGVRFRTPSQDNAVPTHRRSESGGSQSEGRPLARQPSYSIPRIAPPRLSREEDSEHARDVAAAREVSREMDALTFNPPVERTSSPLAPPTLPFAARSGSPNAETVFARDQANKPTIAPLGTPLTDRERKASYGSLRQYDSPSRTSLGEFPMPPAATRTISAGAFKRRADGDSPTAVRRAGAPTLPYPVPRMTAGRETDGEPQNADGEGVQHAEMGTPTRELRAESPTDMPPSYRPENGDPNRGGMRSPASPDGEQYGRLGDVHIANPDESGNPRYGYGSGNFATYLDHS